MRSMAMLPHNPRLCTVQTAAVDLQIRYAMRALLWAQSTCNNDAESFQIWMKSLEEHLQRALEMCSGTRPDPEF